MGPTKVVGPISLCGPDLSPLEGCLAMQDLSFSKGQMNRSDSARMLRPLANALLKQCAESQRTFLG